MEKDKDSFERRLREAEIRLKSVDEARQLLTEIDRAIRGDGVRQGLVDAIRETKARCESLKNSVSREVELIRQTFQRELESAKAALDKELKDAHKKIADLEGRCRALERSQWIAMGGGAVIMFLIQVLFEKYR